MADKKKAVRIRATKDETFTVLKNAAGALFGSKTYNDVSYFGEDPEDSSYMIIIFNEEADT